MGGNDYLVFNLCRLLRENMARVDKEQELSRFICIFARADICRMGGLRWLGHWAPQRTRKERLRSRLQAIKIYLQIRFYLKVHLRIHLQNGKLKVAGPGHHRELHSKERLICRLHSIKIHDNYNATTTHYCTLLC